MTKLTFTVEFKEDNKCNTITLLHSLRNAVNKLTSNYTEEYKIETP